VVVALLLGPAAL
jgi:hypothetical protein